MFVGSTPTQEQSAQVSKVCTNLRNKITTIAFSSFAVKDLFLAIPQYFKATSQEVHRTTQLILLENWED